MPLEYTTEGELAIFTINNGKVNPFNPEMHEQLYHALQNFLRNPDLKVGILTGAGERAFCAGDDIKTRYRPLTAEEKIQRHFMPDLTDASERRYPGWEREVHTIKRFKPMVGAIRGWCLGGGFLHMMNLTDIRVAGRGAKFGLPEIAYGMAGASGHARMYRHLPRSIAMQLVLTGDVMEAEEARRSFLVNEVVDDEAVVERAKQIALRIARHPLLALRAEMEIFVRGEDLPSEQAYTMADHIYRLQRFGMNQESWEVDFQAKGVKA